MVITVAFCGWCEDPTSVGVDDRRRGDPGRGVTTRVETYMTGGVVTRVEERTTDGVTTQSRGVDDRRHDDPK